MPYVLTEVSRVRLTEPLRTMIKKLVPTQYEVVSLWHGEDGFIVFFELTEDVKYSWFKPNVFHDLKIRYESPIINKTFRIDYQLIDTSAPNLPYQRLQANTQR